MRVLFGDVQIEREFERKTPRYVKGRERQDVRFSISRKRHQIERKRIVMEL
jgi:hypothetical protein